MTKPTKLDDQTPNGPVPFDERNEAGREQRADIDSSETDVDTEELQALRDPKLEEQKAAQSAPRPDNNPYSTLDSLHTLSLRKPRRTLDDMRKLSEEIKKTRGDKKIG